MELPRFVYAIRKAREDIKRAEAAERYKAIEASVRNQIKEIFAALPEQKKLEAVGLVLEQSEITEQLLRRFVASCPADKYVTISFPRGETITITGSAPERRGPGW